MFEVAHYRLDKYMSSNRFEVILSPLRYTDKSMLNIIMGSSTCVKYKNNGTLTWLKNLIHRELMYWMKV